MELKVDPLSHSEGKDPLQRRILGNRDHVSRMEHSQEDFERIEQCYFRLATGNQCSTSRMRTYCTGCTCISACVCVHVYMCTCIQDYGCMYICARLCVYMYVYVCRCLYMHRHVCLCICLYKCASVCVYLCACVCTHTCSAYCACVLVRMSRRWMMVCLFLPRCDRLTTLSVCLSLTSMLCTVVVKGPDSPSLRRPAPLKGHDGGS